MKFVTPPPPPDLPSTLFGTGLPDLWGQPLMLLGVILALVYLAARFVSAGKIAQRRPRAPRAARPPRFSRAPRQLRAPEQAPKPAYTDTRPQRVRVMDLHQRGAIFAITQDAVIDGYDLAPLGEVRVDAGARAQQRLARAAAQRFPAANALIQMEQVGGDDGLWRATAVIATPRSADLAPPARYRRDLVLIDGSNVMNWEVDAGTADTPSLRPLAQVLDALKARGVGAGVVFDATAGHRLAGRFLGHDDLAARLPGAADVLVVDRGTQADWVLVDMARAQGLVIISNDHFRDAPSARHLLKQKGYIEGGAVRLLEPRA